MKLRFYEKWMIAFLTKVGDKAYQKDVAIKNDNVIENIYYCEDQHERHTLDIIYPKVKLSKYPIIISIHGGGGGMNSKDKIYRNYALRLAQNNFAVISMNYLLVHQSPFPAQIEDIFSVLRFIHQNADQYRLDKDNIFIVGDSAGAYFAAYAECAITNQKLRHYFKVEDYMKISALALNCGPYDFNYFLSKKTKFPMKKMIVSSMFGSRNFFQLDSYKRSSVLDYVQSAFCPAYIMDTEKMSFIPQAKMLSQSLAKNNVYHQIRTFSKDTNLMHSFHIEGFHPESHLVMKETWDFFKKHLK
jgi:acetyl esterase/lipase